MMKRRKYSNTIGIAFGALLFLSTAANAQRGSQQANGGGGSSQQASSSPPPAQAAPQVARPTYTPPQVSAPAPQQQTYTPPPQRSAPAQQQQTYTPPQQRSNPPAQSNMPSPQRNMPQSVRPDQQQVTTWGSQPRGAEHAAPNVATSRNPNNNSTPQRGNQGQNGYNGRSNGNYGRGNSGYYGNRNGYGNGYGNGYRQGPQSYYYRSYPGLEYGKNQITVRPQGFYYRNRGYYGTYYAPQLGFSLNVLPYGYYPFYHGQSLYYYSDGLYYQRNADANNYSVVAPPIGAAIKSLPDDAQSIVINGVQYYESNGVYYEPIKQDDGSVVYQIAGKDGELNTDGPLADEPPLQIGELVDALPYEYKIIKLNGQKYYMTPDGYYFQDAVDSEGNKVYKVAGVPAEEEDIQPKQ